MFYVLGKEGYNTIFLSQRVFTDFNEAVKYRDSCAQAWQAFIVKIVS